MEKLAYEEQISTIAYYMWEEAGRPENKELEFWLKAEKQFYEMILPLYPNRLFPF